MSISICGKQMTALLDTRSALSYISESNIKHLSNRIHVIEETKAELTDSSRIKLKKATM